MNSDIISDADLDIEEVSQNEEFQLAQLDVAFDDSYAQAGGVDDIEALKDTEDLNIDRPSIDVVDVEEPPEAQGLSYSERYSFEDVSLYGQDEYGALPFTSTTLSYEAITGVLDSSNVFENHFSHAGGSVLGQPDLIMFAPDVDPYNYIYGTNGIDSLSGTSGLDKIYLLDADDTISYSAGADIIYGGQGTDTYDASAEGTNFTINLQLNTARSGSSPADSIYEIENVIGGGGDDVITGNDQVNNILGGAGDDRIVGSDGGDTLDGEGGTNTIDYSDQTAAINVNLSTNTATGAGIGTDNISNFSVVRLGSGDDTATGSASADTFYDGAGVDTIHGGNGDDIFYAGAGDDFLYGDGGDDWIYFDVSSDVTVNLGTSSAFSADTGTDTVSSFSRVVTGSGDDTITGCGCNNIIYSGAGDDVIDAAGGTDVIYTGSGADTITGGSGADTFMFLAADGLADFDTITDFNTGQGDSIDISDVLSGYNSGTDDIHDFVSFVVNGGDVEIHVDIDGTGTDYAATALALITGGAGLDMDTLIGNNDLVVA